MGAYPLLSLALMLPYGSVGDDSLVP